MLRLAIKVHMKWNYDFAIDVMPMKIKVFNNNSALNSQQNNQIMKTDYHLYKGDI
jgi:hypothetical protein